MPALAWLTCAAVERALHQGAPLPGSKVALPVVIGVSTAGALLVSGS